MIFLKLFEFAILKRIKRNLRNSGGTYIGEKSNAEIDADRRMFDRHGPGSWLP